MSSDFVMSARLTWLFPPVGSVGWSLGCEGFRASRADQVGQGLGAAATGLPAAAQRFPQMETFYFDIV